MVNTVLTSFSFQGFALFIKVDGVSRWNTGTFVTDYLPVWLFPLLYIFWKLFKRTEFVRADEMDFYSGIEEIEAETYEEPPPRNFAERVWGWIM
jgi:amino acid transporter